MFLFGHKKWRPKKESSKENSISKLGNQTTKKFLKRVLLVYFLFGLFIWLIFPNFSEMLLILLFFILFGGFFLFIFWKRSGRVSEEILFLHLDLGIGGAERLVVDFAKAVQQTKRKV